MLTDEKRMLAVAKGNVNELTGIFDKYHVQLYNFYYKQNRDAFLSEDLVQNVFERILKYKETYSEDFPFRAWIFRIARNVNTDHYRKKTIKIDDNVEPRDIPVATNEIMDNMNSDEVKNKLERAMSILKIDEKQIIHLTRFENMKYAEVAQVMGITEGTVKVKVHRSMKKLRHFYTNCQKV